MKAAALSRNVDAKGRVTLGEAFANRTVIVEERSDGEVLIRLAKVIPAREAWLYDNEEALASIRRGLNQARAQKFAKEPNMKAAARLAALLEED